MTAKGTYDIGSNQHKKKGKLKVAGRQKDTNKFKTTTKQEPDIRLIDLNNYVKTCKPHQIKNLDADRIKQGDEIADYFFEKYADIPCNGKCIFSSGLPASGKTSVLRDLCKRKNEKYAIVNPDDIKIEMCNRGMIKGDKDYYPMELSPLYHEEASFIAKKLMEKLLAIKKNNIIVDTVFVDKQSAQSKLNSLKDSNYKISGIYVDVTIEMAKKRAYERYVRGLQSAKVGIGYGGRPVFEDFIESMRCDDLKYSSINHKNFVETAGLGYFSYELIVDNNGSQPITIFEKGTYVD